MLKSLKALRPARDAVAELRAELETTRDEVAARSAAIEAIETAPLPVEEALDAFSGWMDRAATGAVDRLNLGYLLQPGRASSGLDLPPGGSGADVLLGLMLATSRDAVMNLIKGQLADHCHLRETIAAADRPARIAKAQAALLEAELAEEAICRALEGAGVEVRRRPDADPRAVLAADEVLQQ